MSIIEEVFSLIYGKPCWQFQKGYGSFLTLEFGQPHLHIQEPRQPRKSVSERVRKSLARRHVYIRGDWHLWIYICSWRIFLNEQLIADNNSSNKIIKRATTELDGQILVRVTVSKSFVAAFEFDLGGRLETIPDNDAYENTSEMWMLYEPTGYVFTLRADGHYRREPGNLPPREDKWTPVVLDDE